MRAMVLSKCAPIETNPLKLTEIDRHEIKKPDEILLKIEACGVCHSQLHGIDKFECSNFHVYYFILKWHYKMKSCFYRYNTRINRIPVQ